jgi:hypothetical protein
MIFYSSFILHPFPMPLPRLICIGDVPVELSQAGATQLYRLFGTYPPEKLQIVIHGKKPANRLPDAASAA